MKTLECDHCGTIIKPFDDGIKYDGLYFCSQECLNEHVNWDTYPIEPSDFELDGEDEDLRVCQGDKYERDGFIFNSKTEYYKYLIVSMSLIIAWVALLAFVFTYPFERE